MTDQSLAWRQFTTALADVLSELGQRHYLILTHTKGRQFVQFAETGSVSSGIAEAVSNLYIEDPALQLTPRRMAKLESMGWRAPAGGPPELARRRQRGNPRPGCPNFHVPLSDVGTTLVLARLAVRTLRTVYGVKALEDLEYESFDGEADVQFMWPTLGIESRFMNEFLAD